MHELIEQELDWPPWEYDPRIPRITVWDMMRLGLDELLGFLEMTKDELQFMMVSEGCVYLEQLAEVLSEHFMICPACGEKYAHKEHFMCYSCMYDHAFYAPNRGYVEVIYF